VSAARREHTASTRACSNFEVSYLSSNIRISLQKYNPYIESPAFVEPSVLF